MRSLPDSTTQAELKPRSHTTGPTLRRDAVPGHVVSRSFGRAHERRIITCSSTAPPRQHQTIGDRHSPRGLWPGSVSSCTSQRSAAARSTHKNDVRTTSTRPLLGRSRASHADLSSRPHTSDYRHGACVLGRLDRPPSHRREHRDASRSHLERHPPRWSGLFLRRHQIVANDEIGSIDAIVEGFPGRTDPFGPPIVAIVMRTNSVGPVRIQSDPNASFRRRPLSSSMGLCCCG